MKKRPINLDLATMTFPIMAIVSIFHRLSGVLLFLLCPIILFYLQTALSSEPGFALFQTGSMSPYHKLVLWAFSSALVYHCLAGLRHLMMDLGVGESLEAGRLSAKGVMGLSILCVILLGLWIW